MKSIPELKPTPVAAGTNNLVVEKSSSVRARSFGSAGSFNGSNEKKRKKDGRKSTTIRVSLTISLFAI